MKQSLSEAIQDEPQRFIDHAFKENPDIKDLDEFRKALNNSFDTDRGNRAKDQFDMQTYADLFKEKDCKEKIKDNIYEEERGNLREKNITLKQENKLNETQIEKEAEKRSEKRIKEMYGEIERGEFEIIKDGSPKVISTPKAFKIGSYIRSGKTIPAYNKGYRKWSKAEVKFIQVRKVKKISPKQIIYDYNDHFSKTPRSSSSLKTKIFRI